MNRRTGALILWLTLACAHLPTAADTRIEGQTFGDRAALGAVELQLNGVGLRAVAWLKAYAAGLYLPARTRQAEGALSMPGPKRIQLRMLLDAPSQEFVKALERGVARNTTEAELAVLRDRLLQLTQAVAGVGRVKKGDVINLDFQPGTGLLVSHNGRALSAAIAADDLFPAVLKIFIGDKPIDPEMKSGLLGGPAV
jgi:Chalcone isomerase-like